MLRQGTVDARSKNIELGTVLRPNGTVDHDLYECFCDARRYDAATSIGWLRARLCPFCWNARERRDRVPVFAEFARPEDATRRRSFRDCLANHFPDPSL